MNASQPIRVAIIGTGARSGYLYAPLLSALPGEVGLVAIWGRSPDSARRLGERLGVPWYTDFDRLMRETAPQVGIVCVNTTPRAAPARAERRRSHDPFWR